MKMNEAYPDIYDEGYIHQFEHIPSHKIQQQQQQKHRVQRNPPIISQWRENNHRKSTGVRINK